MNRTTFQVGTFEVNCSIISESDKAIVVDPGAEATRIRAELKKQGLGLAAVLLTHAHFDHISAIPELQRAYPDLPVFISDAERKGSGVVPRRHRLDGDRRRDRHSRPHAWRRLLPLQDKRRQAGDALLRRHALLRFGRTHRLPRRRHGDAAGISRKAERPSQRHGGGSRPRNRDGHLPRGRVKSLSAVAASRRHCLYDELAGRRNACSTPTPLSASRHFKDKLT